jgi:hypothetical protein
MVPEASGCDGSSPTTNKAEEGKGWSSHENTVASNRAPQDLTTCMLEVWRCHSLRRDKDCLRGTHESSKEQQNKGASVIIVIPLFHAQHVSQEEQQHIQ